MQTYAELAAAITTYMVGHSPTASDLDSFIRLGEAEINRVLRVNEMIRSQSATPTSPFIALPADWLEARNLSVTAGGCIPRSLSFITLDRADLERQRRKGDEARFYTIQGERIEIVPWQAGTAIDLVYYARLTALPTTGAPNSVFLRAPDLYFTASMMNAAEWMVDTDRAASFRTRFGQIAQLMNDAANSAAHSGGPLRTRVRRSY